MVALGNATVNAVFEAHPGSSAEGALARPTPKSDRYASLPRHDSAHSPY